MIDYKNNNFEEPESVSDFVHDCIYTACFVIVFFSLIALATFN